MAVTGLKQTSSTIAIGFDAAETAANTFTQISVDLNLSPLDREVFVVTAINLDPTPPDAIGGVNTRVNTALSTTSQTAVPNLDSSNCLSTANVFFRGAGLVDSVAVYATMAEQPPATLDYLGIIATNDFFVQVEGDQNLSAKSVFGKLYGYRARASADIYAALVQSEVLSA
tara:strand:+ start:990 stop:1502 length:513 start_codon:yes stop_codon:yes gene_type:complete